MGSRVHPRDCFPNPHPHPNPLGFYLYGFVGSRVINSPPKPDPTGSGSDGCPRVRVKLPSLVLNRLPCRFESSPLFKKPSNLYNSIIP